MSTTNTTVLGLVKPTPGTSEPYSQAQVNTNWDAIDSAIGAKTTKFTTTTVQNTVTDTSVMSMTVPANPPQGSIYRLRVWGTYDNSGTAANFQIKAKIGGTQITLVQVNTPASVQTFSGWWADIEVVVATTGGAGTWRGKLTGAKSDSASGTSPLLAIPGSGTTRDTTVSNTLEITIQWSAANAANVVRADGGIAYRETNS